MDFEGATPNSNINQSGFSTHNNSRNSRSRSRSPTMADALNIEIDNYVLQHNRDRMVDEGRGHFDSQGHAMEPVDY